MYSFFNKKNLVLRYLEEQNQYKKYFNQIKFQLINLLKNIKFNLLHNKSNRINYFENKTKNYFVFEEIQLQITIF